ncbi:hypothetical protein L3Q82_019211 [Scortum barcoo]|uniref:Uncharacterized protein n=1 Tax=Scortum barcoo TaxID=214431 RepID=A0ACB8VAG3_9TELE|nr:hypothetical protein L3Q82_019211 [Scortum barcoo]
MSAFCVETQDRTIVFAALKDDCVEWVEKLCHSMFQRDGDSSCNELHMQENQIYASADEDSEFWVVVQRTDAATRCDLQGSYWLQVGQEALLLKEPQKKNIVREWPYELLRRYGKDKLALTIEAGRRCNSGPGTFTFETHKAEKIFSLIQSTIKRKTSTVSLGNQDQEFEKIIVTNKQAHSHLPKTPDMTTMATILENKLRTHERKSPASELGAHAQEDLVGSLGCLSVQPAPITLMPLPLVPTPESRTGGYLYDQSGGVYADPADCIQSVSKPLLNMAVYVDPASILPLKPPSSRESFTSPPKSSASHLCFNIDHADSVYSEVYDKINPGQNKQAGIQSKGKTAVYEPIYTEPMSKKEEMCNESKLDPFAHLYTQVCKTPSYSPSSSSATIPSCPASSSSVTASMRTTKTRDQFLDDVIYENLGII